MRERERKGGRKTDLYEAGERNVEGRERCEESGRGQRDRCRRGRNEGRDRESRIGMRTEREM